jgi:plastocyanin
MSRRACCLVLVAACPATAAEVIVQQVNLSFVPSVVTVNPGDTVRWIRTSGSHTVTSGSNCTANGLFNGPLNSSSPSFVWIVPASAAGTTIPYFCIPHCSVQFGSIVVNAPAVPGDLDGNTRIDGADLGIMLSAWGTSGSADIDADGSVGGSDLGILLANWTG